MPVSTPTIFMYRKLQATTTITNTSSTENASLLQQRKLLHLLQLKLQ